MKLLKSCSDDTTLPQLPCKKPLKAIPFSNRTMRVKCKVEKNTMEDKIDTGISKRHASSSSAVVGLS
jgi:hypothetical protein